MTTKTQFCERIIELEKDVEYLKKELDILLAKGEDSFMLRITKHKLVNAHESLAINTQLRDCSARNEQSGSFYIH